MPPQDNITLLHTIEGKLDDMRSEMATMGALLKQLVDGKLLERVATLEARIATLEKAPGDNRSNITFAITIGVCLIDIIARIYKK